MKLASVLNLWPPFDLGTVDIDPTLPTFRAVNPHVWQPGCYGGLVYPWTVRPTNLGLWDRPWPIRGYVDEDSDAVILAYLLGSDGTALTSADVSQMAYTVTDTRTGIAVSGHSSSELSAGDVVRTAFTSATEARWNRTHNGNFIHPLPATAWPDAGRVYRYECLIVETGGAEFYLTADLTCRPVYGS